jgi:hypothetical protein
MPWERALAMDDCALNGARDLENLGLSSGRLLSPGFRLHSAGRYPARASPGTTC